MYLFGDIGQGLARAPITFYNSGRRFLESTLIVDKDEYTLSDDIRKIRERRPEYRNVDIDWDADTKPAEALPTKLLKVTGYALAWPGRILTTPFLDSMGKTAWENMLRRSRLTVRAVTDFQPEYRDGDAEALKSDRKCYPNGTGGFSRFFQDIQRYINGTKPENKQCEIWPGPQEQSKKIELTLIGHSMGAIVLNELIPLYSRLPYKNIIYMAAASSINDFRRSVTWVLRRSTRDPKKQPIRFYNLMLHPLADARERTAGGLVLTGSLLEWIDDIYEGPKTMIDRTFGMWRNVRQTLHIFPEDVRKQMVFKVFGFRKKKEESGSTFCGDGYRAADPRRHGEFNDTDKCYWRPEFWGAEAGSDVSE